jgi:hypothetical protein
MSLQSSNMTPQFSPISLMRSEPTLSEGKSLLSVENRWQVVGMPHTADLAFGDLSNARRQQLNFYPQFF